jgi:hypothetical protein
VLHLAKLCVGVADVAELRAWQVQRVRENPPLRHLTRQMPRRAAEIVAGGSLYWVVQGAMVVRQRVVDIRPDQLADGSACAALVLEPRLVAVEARPTRPFQGWRYLHPEAAPADVAQAALPRDLAALPDALRRALRDLRLV